MGQGGIPYIGRFAPSPTGPLHAGSLVAALASWLDAQAHGGHWLVRIEDVDTPRGVPGADHLILQQLHACGLQPDAPPVWQSQRSALYQQALVQLIEQHQAYACLCSRKAIATALAALGQQRHRHGELVYPGTCRNAGHTGASLAWRLRTEAGTEASSEACTVHWQDRRLGAQQQDVGEEVGDFVLKRADGCFSYQLAVVVDDAAQGISHVVRGEDLADNTARQIVLQGALGLPTPYYLHTPLVRNAQGEKLSKQSGAKALDTREPLAALNAAARCLDLQPHSGHLGSALAAWVLQWRALYNPVP